MNLRTFGGAMLLSLSDGVGGFKARRFARLLQLYFSRVGTMDHISPNFFDIAAKSITKF